MGLDMYAYRAPAAMVGDAQIDLNNLLFEDGNAKPGVDTDFAYWRKFNALHGWMEDLWRKKGGQGTFNCTTVRLTPDDILDLELSIDIMEPPRRVLLRAADVRQGRQGLGPCVHRQGPGGVRCGRRRVLRLVVVRTAGRWKPPEESS